MIWLYLFLAFSAGWIGRSLRQTQLQRRWTRRAIEKSTADAQEKVKRLFEDGLRDMATRLTPQNEYESIRGYEEQPDPLVRMAKETLRHHGTDGDHGR